MDDDNKKVKRKRAGLNSHIRRQFNTGLMPVYGQFSAEGFAQSRMWFYIGITKEKVLPFPG